MRGSLPKACSTWSIRPKRCAPAPASQGAEAELAALLALDDAARRACGWAIAGLDGNVPLGDAIARFKPGFQSLCAEFETMLADDERERFERSYRELRATVHHRAACPTNSPGWASPIICSTS